MRHCESIPMTHNMQIFSKASFTLGEIFILRKAVFEGIFKAIFDSHMQVDKTIR